MANKKGIWAAFSTVFEKLGSKIGEFRQFFAQIHHYLPKSGEFSRPKTLVLSPKSANIFFMEELTPIKWYKQKWVWVLIIFLSLSLVVMAIPTENKPTSTEKIRENLSTTTPTASTTSTTPTTSATSQISTIETVAPNPPIQTDSPVQQTSVKTAENTNPTAKLYKVVKVIDGDTLDVDINGKTTRLRLIGINTPEVVDPRKPVECFGREASAKAKELLVGQSVGLEADSSQGELDKYGRLLRYVFLPDGRSFNKLMIAEGYAYEYTYNTPYRYQAEYKAAQKSAEENKKGLWADGVCDTFNVQTEPILAPQEAVGHTFYVSSYHTARYYYCDTDSAWKGLSPKYLRSFSSEAELLKAFPDKTLHEECR